MINYSKRWYVYIIEPMFLMGKPYIGKGEGNRADESLLRESRNQGVAMKKRILYSGLTEAEALYIEAVLIRHYGLSTDRGILSNDLYPPLNESLFLSPMVRNIKNDFPQRF